MPTKIRATHPWSFRSGEWATLLTIAPGVGRDCYVVQFPDGVTDFWVVNDPNMGYELTEE